MTENFERGWQTFSFETIDFGPTHVHGAQVTIPVGLAFDRGAGQPQVSFGIVPPGLGQDAVGMHVHRDVPSKTDVEEWWIILEGSGEMTFSNGDATVLEPGVLVATYPGTGHAFRNTGDIPVKLIALLPKMFTTGGPTEPAPDKFEPEFVVDVVDADSFSPLQVHCSQCGGQWSRPEGDSAAATLAPWSRDHECPVDVSKGVQA